MSPEIINGLFALGGAAIGVVGSYLVAKSTSKVSRLSIHKSPIAKLLDVGELIRKDVEISYKGKPIAGLYGGEIAIHNTGNQTVEDIQLQINSSPSSPIVDFEVSIASFSVDKKVKPTNLDQNAIGITIPFLNPKDRIAYTYTVAGDGERPEIIARQRDVEINIRDEMTSWIPDIYAEAMFEGMAKDPINRLLLGAFFKPFRLYLESKKSNK